MRTIDLLDLELDVLTGRDDHGRDEPEPVLVVAGDSDARLVRAQPEVPAEVVDELRRGAWPDPRRPPPALDAWHRQTDPTLVQWGGSSYLLDPSRRAEPGSSPLTSDTLAVSDGRATSASLATSDSPALGALAQLCPSPWWEPAEWADLLAGRLGPWAIAYAADRVTAVCHTPRARRGGAEAGVWTRPEDRGRGLATEVTTAWVAAAHRLGHLFYSHHHDNLASRAVARRLGATPLGWSWKLRRPTGRATT